MNLSETIADAVKPYTKLMPLAAIWLDKSIMAETPTVKPTRRITEGMRVRVEDNGLVDITDDSPATHQITECRGTASNSILELSVIDLKTQELLTIKL